MARRHSGADQSRLPSLTQSNTGVGLSASAAELVEAILHLAFQVQALVGAAASQHDLSHVQARLLGVLRDQRPTMTELAGLMNLEKSSLTGLIDRAENGGLVERVRQDADQRCIRVQLTPDGDRRTTELYEHITERIAELFRYLTSSERHALLCLTRGVVNRPPSPQTLALGPVK
jgi:DNA-binding MarR family transcriptional regulator